MLPCMTFPLVLLTGCLIVLALTGLPTYRHHVRPYLVMRAAVRTRRAMTPLTVVLWRINRRVKVMMRALAEALVPTVQAITAAMAAIRPVVEQAADALTEIGKALAAYPWEEEQLDPDTDD